MVLGKNELVEPGELADRLRQRAQLVSVKIELLELGELADRLRQRAQLVAGKIERMEPGELADRLGQRAQFEVGQFQRLRTVFPGLLDAVEGFSGRVARLFKRPLWHTFVQDFAAFSSK